MEALSARGCHCAASRFSRAWLPQPPRINALGVLPAVTLTDAAASRTRRDQRR